MATLVSIGIVARQIGMHEQTLREYERQGLVEPRRTEGGTRRYSLADIQRIARIQQLTAEGLSLTGVRYVLSLEDQLAHARLRILELERATGAPETISASLALVHIPRPRRSPRWRNADA